MFNPSNFVFFPFLSRTTAPDVGRHSSCDAYNFATFSSFDEMFHSVMGADYLKGGEL